METRSRALTLTLVIMSSFAGGMTTNWILTFPAVQAGGVGATLAQVQAPRPGGPPPPTPPGPLSATPVPPAAITVPPTGLRFRTTDGRIVASIYSDSFGGHLDLYDSNQQAVLKLGVGPTGGNVLVLHRHVETAPRDSGLVLFDETGRARARLFIEGGSSGAGMLFLENVSTNRGHILLPTTICQAQGHQVAECLH